MCKYKTSWLDNISRLTHTKYWYSLHLYNHFCCSISWSVFFFSKYLLLLKFLTHICFWTNYLIPQAWHSSNWLIDGKSKFRVMKQLTSVYVWRFPLACRYSLLWQFLTKVNKSQIKMKYIIHKKLIYSLYVEIQKNRICTPYDHDTYHVHMYMYIWQLAL